MTMIELSQHLRNQEHMLMYAEEAGNKKHIRYHKNLINFFSNKMIRLQKK